MKKPAVGVALTFMLGGGAAAVLLPSSASAEVTTHRSDDPWVPEAAVSGHL